MFPIEICTHTWNPQSGKCMHMCKYCYVKDIRHQVVVDKYAGKPAVVEKEMNTNLYADRYAGDINKIFVCNCSDLFAKDVPSIVITRILEKCSQYPNNEYLFLTKNPERYINYIDKFPPNSTLGATIESDFDNLLQCYSNAPRVSNRIFGMLNLHNHNPKIKRMVSIEPVVYFSPMFAQQIIDINPAYVAVGADSGNNKLDEPDKDRIEILIGRLIKAGIKVYRKDNLERITGKLIGGL